MGVTIRRSTATILRDVADTLRTAQLGLKDVCSTAEPGRRLPGLRNLVVFGRAVTNVLQNLRSTEPEFDRWYQPYVERCVQILCFDISRIYARRF